MHKCLDDILLCFIFLFICVWYISFFFSLVYFVWFLYFRCSTSAVFDFHSVFCIYVLFCICWGFGIFVCLIFFCDFGFNFSFVVFTFLCVVYRLFTRLRFAVWYIVWCFSYFMCFNFFEYILVFIHLCGFVYY